MWNYGLVFGSQHMIQSHSYVCNTMFCIFLALIGYCRCVKPTKYEIIGLIITVIAVIVMFSDPEAERSDGKKGSFFVYSFCLFCAFLAAFFMIINSYLVTVVPVFTLTFCQACIGFLYVSLLCKMLFGERYQFFSMDPYWGAFGFLYED